MSFGYMGCNPKQVWNPVETGRAGELPPEPGTTGQADGNKYVLCRAAENLTANAIAQLDEGDYGVNMAATSSGQSERYVIVPNVSSSPSVTRGVSEGQFFWGLVEGRGVTVNTNIVDTSPSPNGAFTVHQSGQLRSAAANSSNKVSGIIAKESNGRTAVCDVNNPINIGR